MTDQPKSFLLSPEIHSYLWGGRVVGHAGADDRTDVIRAFNDRVAADDRVDCVMLPIADGLSLVRRRT